MRPSSLEARLYQFARNAVKLLGWVLLLAFPPASEAVFVRSQMDRIDHEPLLDSEYFVDVLSFSYPRRWEDAWSASTAPAYRINAASLDCCEFLLAQDLRFDKRLASGLTFRFRLEHLEDKERRELHHWIELEQAVGAGFSALVYGEPTHRKEDSDIGFGLAWGRGPWRVEARHLFVDFNFNSRGSTTQRYARKPFTDAALVTFTGAADQARAFLEYDSPLVREVPDDSRVFSYRRTRAGASWRRLRPGGFSPAVEYTYEFQRKADLFDPDPSGLAAVENSRRVHRAQASAEGPLTADDRLEAGAALVSRSARSDFVHSPSQGLFYRRWELQPYARWRRRVRPWAVAEAAAFLSAGEDRRRSPDGSRPGLFDGLFEAKLGLGADFLSGSSGRIGLYGTFDLDDPGRAWDGGSARAMFFF